MKSLLNKNEERLIRKMGVAMRVKLLNARHKGGWKFDEREYYIRCAQKKLGQFISCYEENSLFEMQEKAADVANYLQMVIDVCERS